MLLVQADNVLLPVLHHDRDKSTASGVIELVQKGGAEGMAIPLVSHLFDQILVNIFIYLLEYHCQVRTPNQVRTLITGLDMNSKDQVRYL